MVDKSRHPLEEEEVPFNPAAPNVSPKSPFYGTSDRPYRPPANTMAGGTAHTAGGRPVDDENLTYFEVVRNLPAEYYLTFYKRPCVRDSQLTGIGAGFAGGCLAFILRRPIRLSCHYAVATWAAASVLHYQTCQHYRGRERDGMRMAKQLMEEKRIRIEAESKARKKAMEEQSKLEAQCKEEERKKTWGYWADKNLRFW